MIDGFGWFEETDYRRAWLLFDEIAYLFRAHHDSRGEIFYPPRVFTCPEYRAELTSVREAAPEIGRIVARDLSDRRVEATLQRIPRVDLHYALEVIESDADLRGLPGRFANPGGAAVCALATKLLMYGARSGAIPIVGRDYAWSLLRRKIELLDAEHAPGVIPIRPSARRDLAFVALGAGLSARFLSTSSLLAVDFDKLMAFKARHTELLRRHQRALEEAVAQLGSLLETEDVDNRLHLLQLQAEREREQLDEALREAWLGAGLDLVRRLGSVDKAPLLSLPALILAVPGQPVMQGLSSFVVAAMTLASAGIEVAETRRKTYRAPIAYLFRAEQMLERHTRRRGT